MEDTVQNRSNRMLAALQSKGCRVTDPRRAVVQVLAEGHQHLSHAEILDAAKEKHPDIGRATVYRTLELLTEMGIIHATYMGDANQRFIVPLGGHHHHLVCNSCGAVQDVDACHFSHALRTLSQETGFQIESHLVELFGKCAQCTKLGVASHSAVPVH